jgi:hypothetical protein
VFGEFHARLAQNIAGAKATVKNKFGSSGQADARPWKGIAANPIVEILNFVIRHSLFEIQRFKKL